MYSVVNITTLQLRTQGDWPAIGNCLVFKPSGIYFGKNNGGSLTNDTMDTIAIVLMTSKNFTGVQDVGLSMSMWQNLRIMNQGFGNKAVIARVVLSPDTFYVTRYRDRPSYTWVDLAGAIGGMASIALAVWIFLFGGGKYKSWGVMQRYVLRTSPDSKKDHETKESSKGAYDRTVDFVRKQLSRLDSSSDSELDHMPLQTGQDRRRASARYSTALNLNSATAAAVVATGSSKGAKSNGASQGGNGYDHRYTIESPVQSNFYFSDQGTPESQSLRPLAPIGEGEDDAEEQVSELIRLIDLRVDERMWSLERTLARYYLDGFRLRNYSYQYANDQFHSGKNMDSDIDPSYNGHNYPMNPSQGVASPPEAPGSPTSPSYPPRPQLRQKYEVIDEEPALASGGKTTPPNNEEITESISSSSSPSSTLSPLGFPQRRDMRGTIRRAVERLQNEWPQSRSPEPYVPSTQYQGRDGSGNSANPVGYTSVNASPGTNNKSNNPPAY
ncbi:hypothetical protein BGX27_002860 [Mortierella sp. AM989]|nr:hypothetical protein BGX27_002860 [Mortierella sp. AM989]